MRAMPSPAESTKPVSRTSSCFSYSLIWSRMTSLISAARICIDLFPPGPERAADQRLEDGGDVGQDGQTIALRQQAEQVADGRREAERGRRLTRDAEPRARIDRRASQDELQARLLEHGGHAPELLRRRDERVARQREQRTGVPLGEPTAAHYAALRSE